MNSDAADLSGRGERTTNRALLRLIREVLTDPRFPAREPEILELPPQKAINPLFGMLNHGDPVIKDRAIRVFGKVVAALADENIERARVVMRRLIWSLNDESGGIGWGAPEAMGEAMALHPVLAAEYAPILLSYIDEDGNLLDYELLEEGALWGLERLIRHRPGLLDGWEPHVIRYLGSPRASSRGLAARLLGFSDRGETVDHLRGLLEDSGEYACIENGARVHRKVSEVARESIHRIQGEGP